MPPATPVADALGHAVIVGAALYKLPQVFQIHRARSAAGVNLPSSISDLVNYICAFAYSYGSNHPFSAYGETLFQGLGTLSVTLQILYYERQRSLRELLHPLVATVAVTVASCHAKTILGARVGTRFLNLLKSFTVIFSFVGRVPQLWSNYQSQAVGELSLSTSALNALGSIVRIFTVYQQLAGDVLMTLTQVLSLGINATLVGQILYYGQHGRRRPSESTGPFSESRAR